MVNKIKLVNCTSQYWEFVRALRNDKRVLNGFIKSTHISKEMQQNYMNNYSRFYRIALLNNQPAGYVGVIDDDIRVCTHPDFQGKGVGKFLINKCVEIWPDAFAKVKIDNDISLKLFESCGFTKKYYILTNK